uniref:NADH-ubiquinone oxidoreductase chain 2 n=1 Tax=Megabalanus tintinnabulum TaxID=261879 RepID=A0A888UU67_9CRUS|nr:NADH dehydrogenase subunit 2 [Megabalanus tintinnabulum]QRC22481.1 NADH dehydrogenase subunit 2 [Megabalanus tintinnabulum]QVE47648.1 NADH dehydrogenase subunit 2 [Megabalanus tintinnabulum]
MLLGHFPPIIYGFFIVLGTMITLSSSTFFGMWMGIEINLMSFIPIILNNESNEKSSEATVKYFLIQAFASAVMIFGAFYFYYYGGSLNSKSPNILVTLALCMKLGMAPFHFWFPKVMEGLNWVGALLLLTWQKIAPLVMLSLFFHHNVLIFMALSSAMIGAISGIIEPSSRKILAFSSISHMGWITATMCFSTIWMNYFFLYCLTSIILCMSFWFLNVNYFVQLASMPESEARFIVFVNLLSLGGLPPLMGFVPKYAVFMVLSENTFVLAILIFSSLITLYFYVRMCMHSFSLYKTIASLAGHVLKRKPLKHFYILSIITSISILGIVPLSLIHF